MTPEEQIIAEFCALEDDWMARYDHLISIGKSMQLMQDKNKKDTNLIKGCQSQVWLHSELQEGKLIFTADSDAAITKGMICILIKVFSNRTPSEVINGNLDFVKQIGLMEHISPTRSNGLLNMFKQMQQDAEEAIPYL